MWLEPTSLANNFEPVVFLFQGGSSYSLRKELQSFSGAGAFLASFCFAPLESHTRQFFMKSLRDQSLHLEHDINVHVFVMW